MRRSKARWQVRRKLTEGVFLGVEQNGDVVRAYEGGPRLFINPRVARRSAGFGGRVFRIWESPEGLQTEQLFL